MYWKSPSQQGRKQTAYQTTNLNENSQIDFVVLSGDLYADQKSQEKDELCECSGEETQDGVLPPLFKTGMLICFQKTVKNV